MAHTTEHPPIDREYYAADPDTIAWEETPYDPEASEVQGDDREVSPTGSRLVSAAERINTALETRAVDHAHSEALTDYRKTDREGYVDHVAALAESDEASLSGQAFGQRELTRENRRVSRQEAIDAAKAKVGRFGRSALAGLKNAGLITVGVGVIAGEKAAEGAKFAGETVAANARVATGIARSEAGRVANAAKETAQAGVDKVTDTVTVGTEAVTGTVNAAKEAVDYRREAASKRKEQAQNRKLERHAKRMARRRKLGQFVLKARASGEAAVDTWQNYPN